MKIQIGKITVSSRGRLLRKLKEAYVNNIHKDKPHLFYYVLGCYDSHWFGICIYRNSDPLEKLKQTIAP